MELASRATVREYLGHADRVNAIAFTPDGETFASASEGGTVRVWAVF
jgi:WD40 repeat protein